MFLRHCISRHQRHLKHFVYANIVEWWWRAPRCLEVPRPRGGTRGCEWEFRVEVPDVMDRFEAEAPDVTWWF